MKVKFLLFFSMLGVLFTTNSWAEITNCKQCSRFSCLKESTYDDCVTAVDDGVCKENASNIKACFEQGEAEALKREQHRKKTEEIINEEMQSSDN